MKTTDNNGGNEDFKVLKRLFTNNGDIMVIFPGKKQRMVMWMAYTDEIKHKQNLPDPAGWLDRFRVESLIFQHRIHKTSYKKLSKTGPKVDLFLSELRIVSYILETST